MFEGQCGANILINVMLRDADGTPVTAASVQGWRTSVTIDEIGAIPSLFVQVDQFSQLLLTPSHIPNVKTFTNIISLR